MAASLAAVGRRDASLLLSRFVPEAIAQRTLAQGTGAVLPPELRQATVMFCDVRSFSTWAEGRSAAEVLALLTMRLERVTEVVMRHGSSVVSFQGDGVMCVFGAPTDHEDDAAAALAAGREITGSLVAGLPGPAAHGGPFRAGAGIHRGEVSSGTVGSAQRLEYAATGDTTVVAARLRAASKEHGVRLLISASTAAARRDAGVELHEVGMVGLRGRSEPIVVLGLDGNPADARQECP